MKVCFNIFFSYLLLFSLNGISETHLHQYPEFKSWIRENNIKELIFNDAANLNEERFFYSTIRYFYGSGGDLLEERYYGIGVHYFFNDSVRTYLDLMSYVHTDRLLENPENTKGYYTKSLRVQDIPYTLYYNFDRGKELVYLFIEASVGYTLSLSLSKVVTYDKNLQTTTICNYAQQGASVEFYPFKDTSSIQVFRTNEFIEYPLHSPLYHEINRSMDHPFPLLKYEYDAVKGNYVYPLSKQRKSVQQYEWIETNYSFEQFRQVEALNFPVKVLNETQSKNKNQFHLATFLSTAYQATRVPDSVLIQKCYATNGTRNDSIISSSFTFKYIGSNTDSSVVLFFSDWGVAPVKSKVIKYGQNREVQLLTYYDMENGDSTCAFVLKNAYGYDQDGNLVFHETSENNLRTRINFVRAADGTYIKDQVLIRCNNENSFSDDPKWIKKTYCTKKNGIKEYGRFSRITKELEALANYGWRIEYVYN